MRRNPLSFLALPVLASLVFAGAGCGGPSAAEQKASAPVKLTVWNVFDNQNAFQDIMTNYQTLHPNVSFDFRLLRSDTYQNELVRAFAEGRGPDIFAVHNTAIGENQALISPMPKSLSIPYTTITGTIKKDKVTTIKTAPTITPGQLRNQFLDVVADDMVHPYQPPSAKAPEDRVWGLPMSVDTLALFYNRNLLNAAGIAQPPSSWDEFQKTDVKKLTTIGPNDAILQSGAAIGTSANVERSFDLLSLLMMQNGTTMVDDRGGAAFSATDENRVSPGAQAVRFYTDFANPLTEAYTWNPKQPPSFDAFADGKTAMFFGYSYHAPLLRARNPKLKFGIAPMPQIGTGGRAINYANYWSETVAKSSANPTWAWDFIQFATSADQVKSYLKTAQKPPALKNLIADNAQDETLSVFANQLLTATSWYRGKDSAVAEKAFLDLIDAVNAGGDADEATAAAENKVNQTL